MLKKIGTAILALAGTLAFAATNGSPKVTLSIGAGVGAPVFTYPVTPYTYPYYGAYPYAFSPPVAPYAYSYNYPYFVGPAVTFGMGGAHTIARIHHGHYGHSHPVTTPAAAGSPAIP